MFGNFIACRLDGLPVRGPACRRCLPYGVRTRTQAPETASEAIFISSSSSEVKPETRGVERAGTSESAVSEREREELTPDRGVVPARSRRFRSLAPTSLFMLPISPHSCHLHPPT